MDAHSITGAALVTTDGDVHRARRQPLNPYFSKVHVASQQDLINAKLDKLCERLGEFASSGETVDLGAAISALQRDVVTDFVLNADYHYLDEKDFAAGMTFVTQGGGEMWRTTKHLPWYGPLMLALPRSFLIKYGDANTSTFMQFVQVFLSASALLGVMQHSLTC